MNSIYLKLISMSLITLAVGCAPKGGSEGKVESASVGVASLQTQSALGDDMGTFEAGMCRFHDVVLFEDDFVTAYQILPDGSCVSQRRSCVNGQLTGSYPLASCNPAPLTCSFNGQTLNDGEGIIAYQNSSGPTCISEMRLCQNGQLSGSYTYSSCKVDAPKSCLFNGQTVAHGAAVTGYQNSSVPYGQSCNQEIRVCNNGSLSGSYSFASCAVDQPAACLFNGQTLEHGASISAYGASSVPYGSICEQQTRTCTDGVLSGSFSYGSCEVGQPAACMFNGQTIAHGQDVEAFQNSAVPYGQDCGSEIRSCSNGTLSGSYNYASCAVDAPRSCSFNGQTIAHGQSVNAFLQGSIEYGSEPGCQMQSRTCNDGTLSGSYTYASCTEGTPQACMFNGQTIAHGTSVAAYGASSVPYGQSCDQQTRTCSNGVLSGSFSYGSCEVGQPAACMFDGRTIAHGEMVTGFQNSTVAYGQECVGETRVCTNGSLSGSFNYGSCVPDAAKACTFNGQTVAHGQTVIGFLNSTVGYGQVCQKESRTCNDGVLSGSYSYGSCEAGQPAACMFDGRTIAHGTAVPAYQNSTVPFGSSCNQESRVCTNGVLSGSFTYGSCQVGQPAACLFNGQTIAHGQSIEAYGQSSVPFGGSCSKQTRTCSNGVLSGSYSFPSCAVGAPLACTFNGRTIPHGGQVTAWNQSTVGEDDDDDDHQHEDCKKKKYCVINKNNGHKKSCGGSGHVQSASLFGGGVANATKAHLPKCAKKYCKIDREHDHKKCNDRSPAQGGMCESETRKCNNGVLSGNYEFDSCASQPTYKACIFNGRTIAHGEIVKAFKSSTSCATGKCDSEDRKCTDGKLSGSYNNATCETDKPAPVTQTKWVNSNSASHQQTCATVGMVPADDLGYGICASGEARPSKGTDFSSIIYKYGTWGNGAENNGGVINIGIYCYRNGQKRDSDKTDKTVAFLCKPKTTSICKPTSAAGWYPANGSHSATCSAVGLKPASNKGYGICASGEARPGQGNMYSSINYKYGTWGNGAENNGGVIVKGQYCYRNPQKQDNDRTDITVAFLCE